MGIFSYTSASFTDKSLSDQSGKIFVVTGGTSGVGELLAGIVYSKNAKVYVAGRSVEKGEQTTKKLRAQYPESQGELVFLHLDLNDLSTIKASAEAFLKKEKKLNVLWNNAGVMLPPQGSKSDQGYELQLGTNNLAPQLFTNLLTPLLKETAKIEPVGSVRVVWVASSAPANFAPNGGVVMNNLDYHQEQGSWHKYGVSKSGNIFQAAEYARRHASDNILSVSLDPGNLKTPLYANTPKWQMPFINLVLKDPIYGAYTELFAGFSPEVQMKDSGRFSELTPSLSRMRITVH
jgi:NAD(P)-dependent dehydrogenase (short-subunit alcohol dehydrogenase family)